MSFVLLNLLALLISQGSAIEFIDNGYENVVVSIHPDVTEENGEKIIEALKTFIADGSLKLFQSTKKLAYIKSVNILIPHTWSLPNVEVSDDYVYNDGQIVVEKANVLYQNAPYTLQSSECGNLGKFIHLTPEYLLNLNDYNGDAEEIFGPHENIFVHEWAKLRYGVFEEYGYPGDLVFPLFTHEPSGDDAYEVEPNFNTNLPLKGELRYKIERFNKKISHNSLFSEILKVVVNVQRMLKPIYLIQNVDSFQQLMKILMSNLQLWQLLSWNGLKTSVNIRMPQVNQPGKILCVIKDQLGMS